MAVKGDTEYVLVAHEQPTLNWSALRLVVGELEYNGFVSPVKLEDTSGNIKTLIEPSESNALVEYLETNGEVIARQSANPSWRERINSFSGPHETVTFVLSALKWFRECVKYRRQAIVEERPESEVEISPQ